MTQGPKTSAPALTLTLNPNPNPGGGHGGAGGGRVGAVLGRAGPAARAVRHEQQQYGRPHGVS